MLSELDERESFTVPADEGFGAYCFGSLAPRLRPLKPERSQRELTRVERALVRLRPRDGVGSANWGKRGESGISAGEEAVAVPVRQEAGRRPRERRAFPRRESCCEVLVHRLGGGAALDPLRLDWLLHSSKLRGKLVDISMNGAAFLLGERMEANERLSLRFLDGQRKQHVDAKGTVLRVSPGEDGVWKVVCKLDSKLSFEDVTSLGRSLPAARFI